MKKENINKEVKNMKKTEKMDVIFILDRSGSMHGSEKDTIGGYNSFIEEQKEKNNLVTTVLFDHDYELLNFRKDIKEVNELTEKEYFTRGCTALYDAIGLTIEKLEKEKIKNKVLFMITTDGLENSSRKYNRTKILEKIKSHKNWEFIYIGADIDSYQEAEKIGIKKSNTANYSKTEEGIKGLFRAAGKLNDMMYECSEINESWKESL